MGEKFTSDELIARATRAHKKRGWYHDQELIAAWRRQGLSEADIQRALSQSERPYGDVDSIVESW
jgi:hypothetical protein